MPVKIATYSQVFELLGVQYGDKAKSVIRMLEREGHTEKSVGYSIWRSQDKLLKLKGDSRFWGAFINSVRQWSWPKGDPRWDDYWKRKREEENAAEEQKRLWQKEKEDQARIDKYFRRHPGFVYFIQGENGGPIKIGYTKDLKSRLSSIQTGHPDILKLLACFPANEKDEQKLHKKFDALRLRGEWFKPLQILLDEIDAIIEKHKELNESKINYHHKVRYPLAEKVD